MWQGNQFDMIWTTSYSWPKSKYSW